MKTIVLTGGGTAGHVNPNIALLPKLQAAGWNIEYIGSENGIEKQLIEKVGIPYHPIASGKLRRYFDLKNLKDPFKVLKGVAQAYVQLRKLKPSVVFSKGGFVSVPVVIGAWMNRIPVIIHESDLTPGLANKIAMPFATKICVTFPESLKHVASDKAEHTGSPIRAEILRGDAKRGLDFCGFRPDKPVLLIMGGSLGSEKINRAIRDSLDQLLERFQIVHICGKGHVDEALQNRSGYRQFEYVYDELPDLFAMTGIVVSRAGANSICEFLALKKPNLLIPLTLQQSRGDQILNAKSFQKLGYSQVLFEEQMPETDLYRLICETYDQRQTYIDNMSQSQQQDSVDRIVELIQQIAKK